MAIVLTSIACNKPIKPTYRYFEYGCQFELTNGCESTSQTTVRTTGPLTYDQIKFNISTWVAPFKVNHIKVWYLTEIREGEMYVFTEKFSCRQLNYNWIENKDTIKNANNYVTFKIKK